MPSTAPLIGRIHLVMVPASDFDRSIAFYETLGFQKRVDVPFEDDHRWVELFPAGGMSGIALVERAPGEAGTPTGLLLTSEDVDATRITLADAGLDVDEAVAREGSGVTVQLGSLPVTDPYPAMFYVRDPDGNSVLIVGD